MQSIMECSVKFDGVERVYEMRRAAIKCNIKFGTSFYIFSTSWWIYTFFHFLMDYTISTAFHFTLNYTSSNLVQHFITPHITVSQYCTSIYFILLYIQLCTMYVIALHYTSHFITYSKVLHRILLCTARQLLLCYISHHLAVHYI